MRRFFVSPQGGDGTFIVGSEKDTAFTVFGARAAMESDARSAGNLQQNGERTLEAGRDSHIDAVGERGDEIIGIFERATDGCEVFIGLAGAAGIAVFYGTEGTMDGVAILAGAD